MRQSLFAAVGLAAAAGCAPKQDPGVPLPPRSTVVAIDAARPVAIESMADVEARGRNAAIHCVADGFWQPRRG